MSVQDLQKIISPKFTEQVVLDIIHKKSGFSNIQVKQIKMGVPSKKGDSYLSTICRFTIDAAGKKEGREDAVSIPVIVKFPHANLGRRKTYRSTEFFENEIIFYNQVWSAFEKFQDEVQVKEKFDSIPLVLSAYFDGENDYVAMLDLGHEGYKSAERGSGLDYDHAVGILHLLARFHGLGLAFKEQRPEEFEKAACSLKETYFSERLRPWYTNFQKNVFVVVRDAVEKELPAKYLDRLNKILDKDLYGLLVESCVVRGPLSVVTHGDVWVPNFLIKYEGKTIKNIKMLDFQLARYTTIVTDLVFFLYSCVDMDLVEHKWDDLLGEYLRVLVESMKGYGAKTVVTMEALKAEIQEHSIMGVGMSMEALIVAQLDDDELSDLDAIQGDEAVPLESVWIIRPFKEKAKRQRIATMIKLAVDRNFI